MSLQNTIKSKTNKKTKKNPQELYKIPTTKKILKTSMNSRYIMLDKTNWADFLTF